VVGVEQISRYVDGPHVCSCLFCSSQSSKNETFFHKWRRREWRKRKKETQEKKRNRASSLQDPQHTLRFAPNDSCDELSLSHQYQSAQHSNYCSLSFVVLFLYTHLFSILRSNKCVYKSRKMKLLYSTAFCFILQNKSTIILLHTNIPQQECLSRTLCQHLLPSSPTCATKIAIGLAVASVLVIMFDMKSL
jgi:hypothetical protein